MWRAIRSSTQRARRTIARMPALADAALDERLAQAAQRAQARREASDYAAESFELSEARELVATAERFVAAVERLTA